jgi:hypothetical protein
MHPIRMAAQNIVFTHFSPKRFRLTDFREPRLGTHIIPMGSLWLSDGDSWLEWCKSERFFIGRYKYRVDMVVDTSQLVVLARDDVAAFARKFGVFTRGTWLIKWDRVRDETGKCGVWFKPTPDYTSNNIRHTWFFGRDVSSVALWSSLCIIHIGKSENVRTSQSGHSPEKSVLPDQIVRVSHDDERPRLPVRPELRV